MPSGPARPIRVLRVIARMNLGGPALHVAALTRGLSAPEYDVVVATGNVGAGEEEAADAVASSGAHLVRVPTLGPALRPVADLRALMTLARLVRRLRPDVVDTHTAKAGFVGRLAALSIRPRPVVVHTFHGHVLEGYFGPTRTALYRWLETLTARWSDALIGVSQATVDDLVALCVAPRSRFRVIPIGLDLAPLAALPVGRSGGFRAEMRVSDDETLVIWMGRLAPIKRVDVLLRAVAVARARGARVVLALVGGGELEGRLRDLARELQLGDAVRFVGYRTDVEGILAGADLAALASDNEGTPVALIEAAAAAVPLVSTDVGGVGDVVAPEAGVLVPHGDHVALGHVIADLAGDEDRRRRMGRAGRDHVIGRFGVDRMVGDADELYRTLLARRGHR
jgi:glycosyltransferase involved in cell wall biosynthesis